MRTSCLNLILPFTNPTSNLVPSRRSSTWKVHANSNSNSNSNNNGRAKGFSPSSKDLVRVKESKGEWKKRDDEEEEPLPEEVVQRIITRVLVSVGAPMGTGLVLMKGYDVLRDQSGLDLPLWVQFSALLLTFGASALGIAYGALSTSWDPEVEGSVLGLEQLQNNWVEMWTDKKEEPSP